MHDRAKIVEENFLQRVKAGNLPKSGNAVSLDDAGLSKAEAAAIFESQIVSRQLDLVARNLQSRGEGFYTIGSSGHEGNAAIAAAFRPDDMAFLHYRDAPFFIQRSKQVDGQTPVWDMLLSFVASSDDPISGGRHKVLGSHALSIPPQTSTIASHLPKAVGAAFSIGLQKRLGRKENVLPDDGVIVCSFGDASLNHSTAQGALNTAGWTAYQKTPLPIVFVCENNDIGISVKTPPHWVSASMKDRAGLEYMACDGLNFLETYKVAREAANFARKKRAPVFLRMKCVRLYGHAGPDVQENYLSKEEIEETEARDPLLYSAAIMIKHGIMSAGDILALYQETGARIARVAEEAITRPKLETAAEVAASIVPSKKPFCFSRESGNLQKIPDQVGESIGSAPQPLSRHINWALHEVMAEDRNVVVMGEDVGKKGGVYTITKNLYQRFGAARVIDTLLDEQSILGLAIGVAHNGFIPIPEIQFLAYVHNAEDQIRGEAATLSFFSKGQFANPMVIRVAGLGYQKGFGGHFHNDNAIAVFRDIPGLIVACPSDPAQAPALLKECVRLAREEQRVVVFLEPIALYMMKDLHTEKDGAWAAVYNGEASVSFGEVYQHGSGEDLCILTYGNGYYLSLQAEKILKDTYGLGVRVVDLRWLCPLPEEAILEAVKGCKNILIVDECRKSGSISEALMALLYDHKNVARHTATDSFIALGRAAAVTMPSKDSIIEHALDLCGVKV